MNKKQVENITKNLITFKIVTNNYESGTLNSNKIDFPCEGIIRLHEQREVYLQIKDIKMIKGVKL